MTTQVVWVVVGRGRLAHAVALADPNLADALGPRWRRTFCGVGHGDRNAPDEMPRCKRCRVIARLLGR